MTDEKVNDELLQGDVILSFGHLVIRPSCHSAILSSAIVVRAMPSCDSAILSFGHLVIRPSCHSAILSFGHLVRSEHHIGGKSLNRNPCRRRLGRRLDGGRNACAGGRAGDLAGARPEACQALRRGPAAGGVRRVRHPTVLISRKVHHALVHSPTEREVRSTWSAPARRDNDYIAMVCREEFDPLASAARSSAAPTLIEGQLIGLAGRRHRRAGDLP